MSPEEKAQRLRDLYAAFGRRDLGAVRACFAPDAVWHEVGRDEHAGTYHGPDEILKSIVSSVPQDWSEFGVELHDVLSNGEHTVALVNWRGLSKHTGQSYSGHSVQVAHIDDEGKLAEVWVIWEDPDQLRAAHG